MADSSLRRFDDWQNIHPMICFLGSVGSGSLLLGSSIAYPILSQDSSGWSSVALFTFFLSAGLFNILKILEIYLYGHYTLAICIIAMILNVASGHVSLLDHIRLIPVYVMGSTFLTAAWPSLFRSLGLPPMTLDDMAAMHDYSRVPMSEVYVDDDTTENVYTNLLQESPRHSSSPFLVATPVPSEQGDTQPLSEPASCCATSPDLIHMGPPSNCSDGTHDTGTSMSLGSQGGCPSEMSSNVATHFFPELAPVRKTQRRRDMESLVRRPSSRVCAHELAEGASDQTDFIKTDLRKSQSM